MHRDPQEMCKSNISVKNLLLDSLPPPLLIQGHLSYNAPAALDSLKNTSKKWILDLLQIKSKIIEIFL